MYLLEQIGQFLDLVQQIFGIDSFLQLFLGEGSGYANSIHTGSMGGLDTADSIFYHQAVLGVNTYAAGTLQVNVGEGFLSFHIRAGDQSGEDTLVYTNGLNVVLDLP